MKHSIFHTRARLVASSAVATLALTASLASVVPAEAASPSSDCATPYPVADLVPDAPVRGLTVTSGTTPTGFTGTVIGVLHDGIAPDIDMVMMRLSSSEIDRVGGIWQGMSGSPVYDATDGQLIGAVAYGLSGGPSPVAGITPFEDMDTYLHTPAPATVRVNDKAARAIAARTDVTRNRAAKGFAQLPMPIGVSGVTPRRLAQLERSAHHSWLPRNTYPMGGTALGTGAGPETVEAGGNLAASLSYGDVTQAGVGTVTSVCHDRVVGFGHPMAFMGKTSMTLHPADAVYIQEDSLGAPFKLANLGAPAGTITDDHMTGITGTLGAPPATATVSSLVAYAGRARTGTTHVSVPQATAAAVFYGTIANHDRVLDATLKGSDPDPRVVGCGACVVGRKGAL